MAKNVNVEIKSGKMVITVDLSKDFGLSTSGKSTIIGSTEGNQSFAVGNDSVYVGLNVYKKVVNK